MSLLIGRQSYVGLAIEDTPGTAEGSPDVIYPFIENTLMEKHEKLLDISSRASRVLNHDARSGKKWGEGDLGVYVDATNIGYLLKLALGTEVKTTVGGTPTVSDHHFIPTVSGNTPKTATLWNARGSNPSVKQHTYSAIDTLELEITNEDIGEATAAFITDYPTKVSAPTLTTTSGTLMAWNNMEVRFGDTYNEAIAASATKMTNFKLEMANNVEAQYRSGSDQPDTITLGELEVSGEYTLFFENDTEADAYRDNTKRCMVVDLLGANIGGGYQERVRLIFRRVFIEENEYETDLDGIIALTQTFRCVQGSSVDPGFFEAIVRNLKSDLY
jgi:hypothetical protein